MSFEQSRNVAASLAFDAQSLDRLKQQAKRDPDKAVAAAAKQFEGLFLGMVLKSMREATPQEGMFDNEQTKLYTSLLDQQLAQHLAARGTGLSEVMARQLSRTMASGVTPDSTSEADPLTLPVTLSMLAPSAATSNKSMPANRDPSSLSPWTVPADLAPLIEPQDLPAIPNAPASLPALPAAALAASPIPAGQTRDFVNRVWNHAVEAARTIGVKPQFMIGQAALESGWGKREIRAADGTPSYNVFGVKAGRGWNGPVVEKATTEYVNGVAQKTTAKFRVYNSYGEAFKDYASLLQKNPRYSAVVAQGQNAKGFANGLQRAGYATDPAYADKLVRVINSSTLRLALQADPAPQMLARR